jgi:hypothetical protein
MSSAYHKYGTVKVSAQKRVRLTLPSRPPPPPSCRGPMLGWPVFVVYLGFAAAYLVRLVAPSAYVFATVSNITYAAAGLACTPAMQTLARRKAGATPRGALPLLILGAASAAHHARPRGGLPAHHLDIVFGWYLVMHLAHSSFAVGARFAVALCGGRAGSKLDRATDAAMYALLATASVLLFANYETLYADQIALYLALGIACAVMTALSRLLLAHGEDDGFTTTSIAMALMEGGVVATSLVSAVFVQGELLGRDLTSSGMNTEAFNLYHGSWHFLIASVAVIVYVRLADVEALIDSSECGTPAEPVTQWSRLDAVALGLLGAYAGMVFILKEADAPIDLAMVLVGVYLLLALLLVLGLKILPCVHQPRSNASRSAFLPVIVPFVAY